MVRARPFVAASYLAAIAAERGDAPAVLDSGRVITFGELDHMARTAASALRGRSIGPGDVVAVQLSNVWEYVVLELAIPLLEAVVMPLPLTLGEAELNRAYDASGARMVIDGGPGAGGTAGAVARTRGIAVVSAADLVEEGRALGREAADPGPDAARIVEIALTSGTTGMPKLAALSAGLKQATFEGFTSRLEVTASDRVLVMSPLMQGIGGMCLFCLRRGAALVMLREARFTPEHTLAVAAETRSTLLVGVPTNVIRMLESAALAGIDLTATRCTAVAGAPMPPDVARRWEERTGAPVVSFYGSMDAGQLAVGSPSDPQGKRWHTVGRPHDSCQCRICDSDGRPLPQGEVGEICMRGPTVQERYWGEGRGPHSDDGWAHMGDLGRIDADGYLEVVGRVKDIIIRGGTNINPYEVEDHIRALPAVRDVCVVGRPDRELGERAVAYLVGDVGIGELRAHLAARGVAKYKWPEAVERLDEIPLSGPGKVDRKLLKEMASADSALR